MKDEWRWAREGQGLLSDFLGEVPPDLRLEKLEEAGAFRAEGAAGAEAWRQEQMWRAQRAARGPGWLEWSDLGVGEGGWGRDGLRGFSGAMKHQFAMGFSVQFAFRMGETGVDSSFSRENPSLSSA